MSADIDPAICRLLGAVALGQGFQFHIAVCQSTRHVSTLLKTLAQTIPARRGGRVNAVHLAPYNLLPRDRALDGEVLAAKVMDELGALPQPWDEELLIVALDATPASAQDAPAWRILFRRMNERRNALIAELDGAFLLCLPDWLEGDFAREAADFWSIRGVSVTLGAESVAANGIPLSADFVQYKTSADAPSEAELTNVRDQLAQSPDDWRAQRRLMILLMRRSDQLLHEGNATEALKIISEALDIAVGLANRDPANNEWQIESAAIQEQIASIFFASGEFARARKMAEEALNIRQHVLGGAHADSLRLMNNLALILSAQGDFSGARGLQKQVLEGVGRLKGDVHPDTLTASDNLAVSLSDEGDLADARILQEQTLKIRQKVQGEEHPDTLTSMNNLAVTLRNQGDLSRARLLLEKVLDVRNKVLGAEHPDTLGAMNNLAITLRALGDIQRARALQEKLLEVSRRVLGAESFHTLTSMNNLAETLRYQGDLLGARALQEQVLMVRRRVLGMEHPDTLTSLNNLAGTMSALGDLPGAREMQEQVLDVQQRVLGDRHQDTSRSAWNLAATLRTLGNQEGVARLRQDCLDWLLTADPATLSADQITIRHQLAQVDGGGQAGAQ